LFFCGRFDFEQKKGKKEKSPSVDRSYDLKAASAFQVYQSDQYAAGNKKKNKNSPKQVENDPLKLVASVARLYGLPVLSKALNSLQYK
jgi:Ca2+-dependent lipid-binding protein